jgi:signal peptidase I
MILGRVIVGSLPGIVMLWEPRQVQPELGPEEPFEPLPPLTLEAPPLPRRRGRYLTIFREVVETLLLALLIFLAVRETVQNFKVEGTSMLPSLQNGQYIIVNKLAYAQFDLGIFDFLPFFDAGDDSTHYLFGTPERGDVVVFESPRNPDRDFIKRVIGVPGDEVEIRSGVVYINGEPLDETYTTGPTTCPCGPWQVTEDHYFVLGDHRSNSSDSRVIGLITEESIIGKAWLSYWPPSEVGPAPNHSVSFASEDSVGQNGE